MKNQEVIITQDKSESLRENNLLHINKKRQL